MAVSTSCAKQQVFAASLALLWAAWAPAIGWAHEATSVGIERLDALLAEHPEDHALALDRVDAWLAAERPEAAIEALRQLAIVEAHADVETSRRFAEAYFMERRWDEASLHLERLIASEAASARTWELVGRIGEARGDNAVATTAYANSMAIAPTVDVALRQAVVLRATGDSRGAVAALVAARDALSGAVVVREALIEAALELGDSDTALAELSAIIESAEVAVPWRLQRADVWESLGYVQQAREERETALEEAELQWSRRRSARARTIREAARRALADEVLP